MSPLMHATQDLFLSRFFYVASLHTAALIAIARIFSFQRPNPLIAGPPGRHSFILALALR